MEYSKELYHHGILGQRWGIRRFQEKNGDLTPAGKKRYGNGNFGGKMHPSKGIDRKEVKQLVKDYNKVNGTHFKYGPDTIVKKGQYTYDYKGRRIKTGQEVSSQNKFVDKYSRTGAKPFTLKKQRTIEELQEELTRKELEKKISDLEPKKVKSGEDHTEQVLKNVGTMLAIGATVASIVVAAQGDKSDAQRANDVLDKGKGLPGQIIDLRKGFK